MEEMKLYKACAAGARDLNCCDYIIGKEAILDEGKVVF